MSGGSRSTPPPAAITAILKRKGKKYVAVGYRISAEEACAAVINGVNNSKKVNSAGPTPAMFGSAELIISINAAKSCTRPIGNAGIPKNRREK